MTIYESYPFATNSWSKIGCVQPDFSAYTVYREIVPTSGTTSPTKTGTGSTGAAKPTDTQQEGQGSGQVTQEDSGGSKAWIVGAVIGPLAAVAIAAFAAFWFGRRRGRKQLADSNNNPPAVAERSAYMEDAEKHPAASTSPTLFSPTGTMAELSATRPLELDSSPIPRREGDGPRT